MKTGSNSSPSLVLLIILAIGIPAALSGSTPDSVLDTTGKPLRTGFNYFMLVNTPAGRYRGVILKSIRNNTCPLDVVQPTNPSSNGIPFTFTPVDPKKGVIQLSTDLNIEFIGATICIQSTVWRLAGSDELTGQRFITTGGVKGNPGRETLSNWFKIEKIEDQYKLIFCPTVCDFCRPICMDVGRYLEDGVIRLALTSDDPIRIRFKKDDGTGSVQNH